MPATVKLVLPGLFDLPLEELAPGLLDEGLPHLNRFLRLATPKVNQTYSIDSILKTALGLDGPQGLPLAQAFARDKDQEPTRLLLSQAVHLQAGLHSAVIVPIPNHKKNIHDISFIIKDLSDIFKVDCDIRAIADGLFLLRLKAFEAPTHYPHILSVLGKTANPYIEQSRAVMPWYQLLNEIQMFMHQHEVNVQRLQRGMLPINSLWCWGAGSPPAAFETPLDWYCDDVVLNQFALSLGLTPNPRSAVERIDHNADAVVIDLSLLELLKAGEARELDQLLLDVDQKLVKPLLQANEKNRCRVLLMAGYPSNFELKPHARMKFWRGRKNLSDWPGGSQVP